MQGPYKDLHIYEVEGVLEKIPETWREAGFLGCWYDGGYSFLFFSTPRQEMLEEYLAAQAGMRLRTALFLPYEEWESGTSLRPFRVGPLRFAPPWADPWPGPERETVLVDPGVTFGSGFHESTRGCLELLIRFCGREKPERVLDLGTGSGILALAAARLGARRVLAVDLQPVSVETARANVVRNGLEDRIEVRLGDALQVLAEPADLILANLHLDLLKEIVREPAFQKAPWSILSGLAGRQVDRMKETLGNLPLQIVETRSDGAWSSLLLARDGKSPLGGRGSGIMGVL